MRAGDNYQIIRKGISLTSSAQNNETNASEDTTDQHL
jgi:hypothetical protein